MYRLLIILIGWVICSFLSTGWHMAYMSREWPTIEIRWDMYVLAALIFLVGPVGLIPTFITKAWKHGWTLTPNTDRKYQEILDRLDRKKSLFSKN